MIPTHIKEALKRNWGEKADSLSCYAEVKLIDPLSSWQCYIYAMDYDEELIQAVLYTKMHGAQTVLMPYADILIMFNSNGENPSIDEEYRRMTLSELLRRLK